MTFTTLKRSFSLIVSVAAFGIVCVPPSSAGEQDGQADEELPVLGSAQPALDGENGGEEIDAQVAVNYLQQEENGGYTSLTWTLRNNESKSIKITDFTNETYTYGIKGVTEASGVTLVDEEKGTRYHPLKDSSEEEICLCSGAERPNNFHRSVSDGEQATYWSAFSLPEDISTVTVEIPNFGPIEDVQIE